MNKDVLLLPLNIVDISRLCSLTLSGAMSSKIVYQLNRLYASRSFIRLTDLQVELAVFEKALEMSNLPSLKLLSYGLSYGPFLYHLNCSGLVAPADFPLRELVWRGLHPLLHSQLESVLTKVKGLEHLEIESCEASYNRDQEALTEAIMMHKATLNTLLIYEEIDNQPLIYDEEFVRQILEGKQLEKLTLPLPPKKLASYYNNIIASLRSWEVFGYTAWYRTSQCGIVPMVSN